MALLITYDPNRTAGSIPANVERYIDLYQSSNVLGGGDLAPGHGFHGHYAAFNLKDRPEIVHVNMDKFEGIQVQLAAKIRSAAAGGGGDAVPLHSFSVGRADRTVGFRRAGPGARRRHGAIARGGLSRAGLGGGADQSEGRECRADRGPAHRHPALCRKAADAGWSTRSVEPGVERRAGSGRCRGAEFGFKFCADPERHVESRTKPGGERCAEPGGEP